MSRVAALLLSLGSAKLARRNLICLREQSYSSCGYRRDYDLFRDDGGSRFRPGTLGQGVLGKQVHGMAQLLVTGPSMVVRLGPASSRSRSAVFTDVVEHGSLIIGVQP
jgi:hypothetical protein